MRYSSEHLGADPMNTPIQECNVTFSIQSMVLVAMHVHKR